MTKPILSRAPAQAVALLGVSLLALGCPLPASAAAGVPPTGESTPLTLNSAPGTSHPGSGGPSLVRTVVGLAIVIAVIWGLYWVMRQVKTGREPRGSSAGLASVAALTLGSGRSVHLVRAGSDYVLLASAEHGLVPIHRYTEEQAREAGLDVVDVQVQSPRRLRAPLQLPAGAEDPRHDPMRMPSTPGSGLLERVREWTVRQ